VGRALAPAATIAGLLAVLAGTPVALGAPEGGQVVRGTADITREGDRTIIRASDRTILNFRSFDIGARETVQFVQPNANARVLSRIESAAPTRIDGSLLANGRVYIVNPAGVVFGRDATVNVAGLFAAAGAMSDADFLRGVDKVTGLSGPVRNEGRIDASRVVLAGKSVANAGAIVAPQGSIVMAAGQEVVIASRNDTMHVRVSGGADVGADGAAVSNTGSVEARRGRVVMAAGDTFGLAINTTGSVRAKDVRIEGQGAGRVVASGTIDASDQREVRSSGGVAIVRGTSAAARGPSVAAPTTTAGGSVTITGETVGVIGASIDASGASGGGSVRVGGDVRGQGDLRRAEVAFVDATSTIRADATDAGRGGSVVVWADDTTRSGGAISARGGANGGDGGFIETSAKKHLAVDGKAIDASASKGDAGLWLLDPRNVLINNAGPLTGTFSGANPDVFTPSNDDSTIAASDIASRLDAGTSVTITTGADGTQAGNITVSANITRSAGTGTPTLRLQAANNVLIATGVAIAATNGTAMNVELIANSGGANDPDPTSGALAMQGGSSIVTGGGSIVLGGGTGSVTQAGLFDPFSASYASDLTATAARGNADQAAGVFLDGATLNAGAGTVSIRGVGRADANNAPGVRIENGSQVIGASVQVDGLGGAVTNGPSTGDSNIGVAARGATTSITSTGPEGFGLRGVGGSAAGADSASGVVVDDATVRAQNGGIGIVTGIGSAGSGAGSHGVLITNGANVAADALTLGARAGGAADAAIATSGAASTIEGVSVALVADKVDLASATYAATGGNPASVLTFRPLTDALGMGIGDGAAGTLSLSNAELTPIFASNFGTVVFGATNAGLVSTANVSFAPLAGNLTLRGASLDTAGLTGGASNALTLDIAGSATQTGILTVDKLVLLGAGQYQLTLANDANTLAGNSTGSLRFYDADDIAIGTVGSTTGLAVAGLSDVGSFGGSISVNSAVTIAQGASLFLNAGEVDVGAAINGPGALTLQPLDVAANVIVGGAGPSSDFDVTQAELAFLGTGAGLSRLTIGQALGTGALSFPAAVTFTNDTFLRMGGMGGVINVANALRGQDASVNLVGGTVNLSANIVTNANPISIEGAARLLADIQLDTTDAGAALAGANIDLNATVDADDGANNRALTLTTGAAGRATLAQNVGFQQRLGTLTHSGQSAGVNGVRTTGAQTYNAPVAIAGEVSRSGPGGFTFNNAVTVGADAQVFTAGAAGDNASFLGGVSGPGDLVVSVGAGLIALKDVITTGDQTYNGAGVFMLSDLAGALVVFNAPVILEEATRFEGTAGLRFNSTIDSQTNEDNPLGVIGPTILLAGDVGAASGGRVAGLLTGQTGEITIGASRIRALASVIFGTDVVLRNDLDIVSNNDEVAFNGSLQSEAAARSLAVAAPSGLTFGGPVGTTNPLQSIAVASGVPTNIAGNVATVGPQDYGGAVELFDDVVLTGSGVTFRSTVDSGNGNRALTIAVGSGTIDFQGDAGVTRLLGSLDATGSLIRVRNVGTDGAQRYTGSTESSGNLRAISAAPIDFSSRLTLLGDTSVRSGGGAISFGGRVESTGTARALVVDAGSGSVAFRDEVGTSTATGDAGVASMNVTGAGIGLRAVRTTGAQVYTGATTLQGALTSTQVGAIGIAGSTRLLADASITTTVGDILLQGAVDSDETARNLALNTGGNSITRISGTVGATNRLATLTTNADGSTVIAATQVRTTGDQQYNDAVRLGSNATLEGNDVVFARTLDSDASSTPRALTINTGANGADTGETTFTQRVGGTARLASITTNTEGSTRIGSDVSTTRGMTFGDAVVVLGSTTLDGGSGTMFFRNALDADSSTTDPTVTILSSAASDFDTVAFRFNGNVGSTRRLGGLTLGVDRASPARGASIVFSDGFDAQGRVTASSVASTDQFTITTGSGGFAMGRGHKLTAFGNVRVNTTGVATLGDITALGNINVTASDIRIQRRPAGDVFDNVLQTPDALLRDSGVDFLSGGTIDFTQRPTLLGDGPRPTFGQATPGIDPQLSDFIFREAGTVSQAQFVDPRNTSILLQLDLRTSGASQTTITSEVTSPIFEVDVPGSAAPGLPPSQDALVAGALEELGIRVRERTLEDTLDALTGRTFADAPPGTSASDPVSPARVSPQAARRAADAYGALVLQQRLDDSGSPVLDDAGNPVFDRVSDQVRDALARSWDRYAARVPQPTGDGWRAYLESLGSGANVHEARALRSLEVAADALDALDDLGLSPAELRAPRARILGEIKPPQIASDEEFEQAVRGPRTLSAR
jgi:filamentous hemagglutinin family protein